MLARCSLLLPEVTGSSCQVWPGVSGVEDSDSGRKEAKLLAGRLSWGMNGLVHSLRNLRFLSSPNRYDCRELALIF